MLCDQNILRLNISMNPTTFMHVTKSFHYLEYDRSSYFLIYRWCQVLYITTQISAIAEIHKKMIVITILINVKDSDDIRMI